MKRLFPYLLTVVMLIGVFSCDKKSIEDESKENSEQQDSIMTYEKQKQIEATQIKKWISDHNIIVTGPSSLLEDSTSNVENNEYALFADLGIYMQIVRCGDGSPIEDGETRYYNARYVEVNIGTGDTLTTNMYQQEPDAFYLRCTGDNYTGAYTGGLMPKTYGTTMPNAWMLPFLYIKPGTMSGSSAAKIRLIVPHIHGTQKAAAEVYPTYYEIIITSQRWQ